MSVEGRYFAWTVTAGEDLTDLTPGKGKLFKAISFCGKLAHKSSDAIGIMLYGGAEGEHVTSGISGVIKFTAGADINPGEDLIVGKDGYMIPAVNTGQRTVGRCLDAPVNEGAIGTGFFNFATLGGLVLIDNQEVTREIDAREEQSKSLYVKILDAESQLSLRNRESKANLEALDRLYKLRGKPEGNK